METGQGLGGNGLGAWWGRLRSLSLRVRALGHGLLREPITRRRAGIVLAEVLVCCYAACVLGYVLATPEIGVRCAFTPIVNHFYPAFLYPEQQEPLLEGDHIVEVAGQPVENWSQLLRKMLLLRDEKAESIPGLSAEGLVAGRAKANRGFVSLDGLRLVRVVYERPGETGQRTAWCRLGRSPIETLVPSVLWFFLKVGLFIVGAIVFWKRPEDRSAAQFFWLCLVSFGAYMGGYHWSRIVTQPVLILVFMICAVMLPAVTLHFYLLFPRAKGFFERHHRGVLIGIYGPAVFFLLLLLQGYLLVRWLEQGSGSGPFPVGAGSLRGSPGSVSMLEVMLAEIYIYFGIATLWYLLSLASLVHSFRTAATPVERNQVKWILVGVTAATVPIGYTLYLAFWEQGRFGGGAATWPMFAASACVTAAYVVSITRYRLMQLDQLVSSGMMYFVVSTLVGLFYYGVVFAGLLLIGSQSSEGPSLVQVVAVSSTVLLLLVALSTWPGAGSSTPWIGTSAAKSISSTAPCERMSQAIDQLGRSAHARAPAPAHHGGDAVGPRWSGLPATGRAAAVPADGVDRPGTPLHELSSGCPLVEALFNHGTLGEVIVSPAPKHGNGVSGGPAMRQLHFLQGAIAQALVHEGQLLGLLLLGPRPESHYTPEDVQLLAAFAQITALALVSAEGHRTIDSLNRDLKAKVEKIAEQQRRILALQSQLKREDRKPPAEESASAGPVPTPPAPAVEPVVVSEEGLVGSSAQVQHLMSRVKRAAASSSAVLLRGESGAGKGLVARTLHDSSPRANKPFVKVHCAALSAGLLESELFGHVKGAFTSAIRDKVGRFESAHGGTLFFDEIGDISLEVQTKLLRVLEEMTFERVGSSEPVQVDVRIIAATHRDLDGMIKQGSFREDLFFRLNILRIDMPTLREHPEDIPELVQHFLKLYSQKAAKQVTAVDDDALVVLKSFRWPGNVRQLENAWDRACSPLHRGADDHGGRSARRR